MGNRILDWIKEHRKGLIIFAVIIVLLIAAFAGFKILVKVGSPKYFYNYMHNAQGSLPVEYHEEALKGADSTAAFSTENTSPRGHNITESIEVDGRTVMSYTRHEPISFGEEQAQILSQTKGLTTFRGSCLRDTSSVGRPDVTSEKFEKSWVFSTGKVLKSNGVDYWSGNGWTGQPLVIQWSQTAKKVMNLFPEAKEKADLVEVIYPGMDGSIHFLDMETGEETRPAIHVGMTFKGTASLYPGEVPLLFCGSGDAQTGEFGENVSQRFYIYSLIDGRLLWQGGYDDDFAPRIWHAYDSSPIIDPLTDTLIQPGENGVIYTMKLGTQYDPKAGTVSVNPSNTVKYTFTIEDKYSEGGYLWGSECSACVFANLLFIGDNAGTIYCLDLNTMKMVWVDELNEDINSSPIFTEEDGGRYLYVATTLKYNYNSHSMGEACICKLNAMNGEIIWRKPYEVHTVKGYAGGILSTGAPGDGIVKDYIFYSVSKTPEIEGGYLVALDKKTGEEVWKLDLDMYSWSSTVLTYAVSGQAYLIQGCQNGDLLLVDASNGRILDRCNFASGIEATPVIFNNSIVLATRSEKIIGVTLK